MSRSCDSCRSSHFASREASAPSHSRRFALAGVVAGEPTVVRSRQTVISSSRAFKTHHRQFSTLRNSKVVKVLLQKEKEESQQSFPEIRKKVPDMAIWVLTLEDERCRGLEVSFQLMFSGKRRRRNPQQSVTPRAEVDVICPQKFVCVAKCLVSMLRRQEHAEFPLDPCVRRISLQSPAAANIDVVDVVFLRGQVGISSGSKF